MATKRETKARRELLHAKARKMCLLTNRYEFIKLAPVWIMDAELPMPSSLKTLYNDWDWIMKQELDVSHRRDEAARLITMAEDLAIANEDPSVVLRAAELILKHSTPFSDDNTVLKQALNKTADLANSFGTRDPGTPQPPEEVQEWMDEMRQRDGEA